MTKARLDRVNRVLAQRQPDLTVLLDGVHKPHNVAAILRSCDAVGVLEVHLARPRCGFGKHHATSGGTQKWMKLHQYETVIEAISRLKKQGFQILAANKSAQAREYNHIDYTRPTALMMGAELFGIDREALNLIDGEVFIPMMGMVESFNVSVACAILLAEAQRQRLEAGHYDRCKLSPGQLQQMRFEWLHPGLVTHYQKQGKSYPALDEDGDIITKS